MNSIIAILALSLSLLQQPQVTRKGQAARGHHYSAPTVSITIKAPVAVTVIRGHDNLVFNTQAAPPAP